MGIINQFEIIIGVIGIIVAIPPSIQAGMYIREQWREKRKRKKTL